MKSTERVLRGPSFWNLPWDFQPAYSRRSLAGELGGFRVVS